MADKDLKDASVDLGHAFKKFGKTFVRSAETTAKNIDDWANDRPKEEYQESTVYSDGSWKETGKEMGDAAKNFGKALIREIKDDNKDKEENPPQ